MFFSSDNASAVHPDVMAALVDTNQSFTASYGADPIMDQVRSKIRELFEAPEAAVYLVSTGTAANALSLAVHVAPWQTLYCHPFSHIQNDECNAPEFYTGGAKVKLVDGENGLMTPAGLDAAISGTVQGDVHTAQRGAVSFTNLSEAGTLYTPDMVQALANVANSYDVPVHMDGARLANAIVSAGCSPAEMTWKSGVDIVSIGGTKNGLMGAEAVVLFDPDKAWEFELRRKRAGHLFSKHRYLSIQMAAYLNDNLWLDIAADANNSAARLSQGLSQVDGVTLLHPTEGNMIFMSMARALHRRVMSAGAKYYFTTPGTTLDGPDDEVLGARLVCSWSTTDQDVDQFLNALQG